MIILIPLVIYHETCDNGDDTYVRSSSERENDKTVEDHGTDYVEI